MTKRRWRNRDKRMEAAVNLRRQGLSLRQIGRELDVVEGTVRNDLARWERERPTEIETARRRLRSVGCVIQPSQSAQSVRKLRSGIAHQGGVA